MPSFGEVAARATMSGVGVLDAVRSSVFTPGMVATASVFAQSKTKEIWLAGKAWLSVSEITKDCAPPPEIVAGVFGAPMGTFCTLVC